MEQINTVTALSFLQTYDMSSAFKTLPLHTKSPHPSTSNGAKKQGDRPKLLTNLYVFSI
jgi:hypothetical protein